MRRKLLCSVDVGVLVDGSDVIRRMDSFLPRFVDQKIQFNGSLVVFPNVTIKSFHYLRIILITSTTTFLFSSLRFGVFSVHFYCFPGGLFTVVVLNDLVEEIFEHFLDSCVCKR